MGDLLSEYLDYTSDTEVPAIFHRWSFLVGLGALLGRQYYLPHGFGNINPNQYVMLIGNPGTRKGTAIKIMKKVLAGAGYGTFSAERTSKEKFLLDLAGEDTPAGVEDILEQNIFGDTCEAAREMFIAIDEMNDFLGNGNIEFISMLGNMWNYEGQYTNRIKTGKSVVIQDPTISMLGGNTPTNLKLAFPVEVIGQGFFSRLILVHGEPNGKLITFPQPPSSERTRALVELFKLAKQRVVGPAKLSESSKKLLDGIYRSNFKPDDVRFENYSKRRFDHLIKLCLVTSASRLSTEINESDVILSNTILCYTEHFMPKALGEFGRARNSDVTNKVLDFILNADGVVNRKDIWKQVSQDLEKMADLVPILQNLIEADKIQIVREVNGFLPKRKVLDLATGTGYVDYSLLTDEEMKVKVKDDNH